MTTDGRLRPSRGTAATLSLALAAGMVSALVATTGTVPASPAPGQASGPAPVGAAPGAPDETRSDVPTDPTARAAAGGPSEPPADVPAGSPPDAPADLSAEPLPDQPDQPDRPDQPDQPDRPDQPDQDAPAPAAPSADVVPGAPVTPAPAVATAPGAPAAAPAAPGVVTGTLTRTWAEAHPATAAGTHEDDGHDGHHGDHDDHDGGLDGHDDHAGGLDAAGARLLAWVETDAAAFPVTVADVGHVEDGSTVTVDLAPQADGTHPARVLAVEPPVAAAGGLLYGEGSQDVFGVAAAAVQHDVTVVLAVPAGASPDSMTTASVVAAVDGAVDTYWTQQSRGQRGFQVTAAHGWQQLRSSCSSPFALWDEVAAAVGFVAGPRKHLVVYLPPAAGCGAGLGTIGSPDSGGRSWVGYASPSIIAHELGHNLGLGHSNGLLCASTADGEWSGSAWQSGCAAHDYRDYYDVMGVSWTHLGSLAAPQADALGLLRSTEKLTLSTPARVRLVPASSDGLRVLRVDDPGGTYYVEYRTAAGWDAWLSGNSRGLDAGVLVHRTSPARAREVLLLDGSVSAGTRTDDWRAALQPGGSFTSASGRTRVVVEEASGTGATLVVYRDGVGPTPVVPPADGALVEVSAPAAPLAAGTVTLTGVASAPEGTLLWEVTQGSTRLASGFAQTGANGTFGSFWVPVALPAGTFSFRAWVPDESGGETDLAPALTSDSVTLTVR